MVIRATQNLRMRSLENSAAVALMAANMPPMPRPVKKRQMRRSAEIAGMRTEVHADGHDEQERQDGAAPPDVVGDPAEQE